MKLGTGSRVGAVALLLLMSAPPATASTEPFEAPRTVRFGIGIDGVDDLAASGVPLQYGSFWVGAWTQASGWGYAETQLLAAKSRNVTPVVLWWYWGDDISPACVEDGCQGYLHDVWKDRAAWSRMTGELASLLARTMGDAPAIVVLEPEFNKNGVESWETFDGLLADEATRLKSAGGNVDVVIGFGNWGHPRWAAFDRAVAAADMGGTQLLRSSVRDASTYDLAVDQLILGATTLRDTFGATTLVYDLILSSYPEPDWAARQEAAIQRIFAHLPDLKAAGVHGIVWRSYEDNPRFDTRNYHGVAERHWGLVRADGTAKPAYDDFVRGVKREAFVPSTEVEDFATKDAGAPLGDAAASGGAAWILHSNGAVETSIFLPEDGWWRIAAVARGTSANGVGARLEAYVDGVHVGGFPTGAAFAEHAASLELASGWHTVRLAFVNDAWTTTGDRNLVLDRLLVASTAPRGAAAPGGLEAEAFAERTTGGLVASSARSGGAAWNVWSNGHLEDAFLVPEAGDWRVTAVAAGDPAEGVWPRMVVRVNGADVAAFTVSSREYRAYSTVLDLPAGPADVRVAFTNDLRTAAEDRNLRVDLVKVAKPPILAWSGEAEAAPVKSTGGRYADAAASAGAGWNVWSNGHVAWTVTTAAPANELRIDAKGSYAKGWPLMRAYVDGALVAEWTVASSTHRTYTAAIDLPAGPHEVKIAFVNDHYASGADRNLLVDRVGLWKG